MAAEINTETKAEFLQAMIDLRHSAGWLRSRQRELTEAFRTHHHFTQFGQHDETSSKRVGELGQHCDDAWKETREAKSKLLEKAFAPLDKVNTESPTEWLFRVRNEAATLVSLLGQGEAAYREMSESEDARFRTLLTSLDATIENIDSFVVRTNPTGKADRVAQAMGLRANHPDWTDAKIAEEVGIDAGQLSRSERYQRIKKATIPPPPPRGSKDAETREIHAKDR